MEGNIKKQEYQLNGLQVLQNGIVNANRLAEMPPLRPDFDIIS